jgi:RHS repeat-associated protein
MMTEAGLAAVATGAAIMLVGQKPVSQSFAAQLSSLKRVRHSMGRGVRSRAYRKCLPHNQRVSLTDSVTSATTVYDANHNYLPAAVYLPTGSGKEHQTLYGYDERHRLVSLTHQLCTISSGHSCSATTATGSDGYAYDVNDNRTQVNESNGVTSSDRRYCYDAQDRLIYRNTATACSSSAKDESYAYDAAGNRTQAVVGGTTTNFAYDGNGQLCRTAGTTCGTPNVSYDDAGRTRNWAGWWLTYDGEGRLTKACKSSTCASTADRVEMAYDGDGNRTQIVTTPASGSATTVDFAYQGSALVEERTNGSLSRQYTVDETGTIVKLTIPAGQADAGTYLVTWNGHGDALALNRINADGSLTLANSFSYSSWGAPTTATHNGIGDLGFRFLYVGQYGVAWDNALGLGLHYMRARHYAPALGRFLQPDPSRLEANQYSYASNTPLVAIDPGGLMATIVDRTGGAPGPGGSGGGVTWNPGAEFWVDMALWFVPGSWILRVARIGTRLWGLVRVGRLLQGTRPLSGAERAAIAYLVNNKNNMDHLFQVGHGLAPLIRKYGSKEEVVKRIVVSLPRMPNGRFERWRYIGGQLVVIRGYVINGVPKIGTAFTPK